MEKKEEKKNQQGGTKKIKNPSVDLLTTAAVSLAIVSCIATASGLSQYVFDKGKYWQALIISTAIQGTLFTLSIKGPALIMRKTGRTKWLRAIFVILVWFIAMVASFLFSYVYISSTAYSHTLLMQDAHSILSKDCLALNFELDADAKNTMDSLQGSMNSYITTLSTVGSARAEESEKLDQTKQDTIQGVIDNLPEQSDAIGSLLNKLGDGTLTNDERDILLEGIKQLLKDNNSIYEDKTAARSNAYDALSDIQQRLASFMNTNSPVYQGLIDQQSETNKIITELSHDIGSLEEERRALNEAYLLLADDNSNLKTRLDASVLALRKFFNALDENSNMQDLLKISSEIYNVLIENNVSENDPRLEKYAQFKIDVKNYEYAAKAYITLEKERSELNKVYEETLDPAGARLENTAFSEVEWKTYWVSRLNQLEIVIGQLEEINSLDNEYAKSQIEQLASRKRLYLSDLNDLDRAFSLLFQEHEHKNIIFFSIGFAVFIDLFAFFIGWLLFALSKKQADDYLREPVNSSPKST